MLSPLPLGFQLEQEENNKSSLYKNRLLIFLHKLFNTKASLYHQHGGEGSVQHPGYAKPALSQLYFLPGVEPYWGCCIAESLQASRDASSLKRAILVARIIGA